MSVQENEDCFLPLMLKDLTESLKQKARKELGESDEAIREGLKELKALIKEKQVPACTDDDFLVMFLRSKKFNIKKSFDQVKSYSYQRHIMMNYYGFMFVDKIMPAIHHNICGILPKRDHEGRAIIYFLPCKLTRDICSPDDVLRALQALAHFALKFPATQVSGFSLISDGKIPSFQTAQLVFRYVKFCLPTIHAFPARFQSVNILNTNVFVRTFFPIVRPLIPEKLVGRITFHDSNDKALLSDFDASILPTEFGGTMGPLSKVSEQTIDELKEFIPTFQATNRFFKRKDTIPFPDS